jgi:hypothetical protein
VYDTGDRDCVLILFLTLFVHSLDLRPCDAARSEEAGHAFAVPSIYQWLVEVTHANWFFGFFGFCFFLVLVLVLTFPRFALTPSDPSNPFGQALAQCAQQARAQYSSKGAAQSNGSTVTTVTSSTTEGGNGSTSPPVRHGQHERKMLLYKSIGTD